MAPLPLYLQAVISRSPNSVGGNEPALSWSTLFSFGAILFAAMQGTLAMESGPCLISHQKWKVLLILEFLEVLVVVVSKIFSFIELRNPFRTRMEWLQWLLLFSW